MKNQSIFVNGSLLFAACENVFLAGFDIVSKNDTDVAHYNFSRFW